MDDRLADHIDLALAAFWLEVCAVARAVQDAVGSSTINCEIHGNTVPHLHLHVFPRCPAPPDADVYAALSVASPSS